MSMIKLKPAFKDYVWGGDRLKKDFGKEWAGDVLAETWELSAHPDGPSMIASGSFAGKTFPEYLKEKGKAILGTNAARFQDFPVLIKFIDARENLSLQVHPGDEYALRHEGQYGKTECWYIVEAKPGAGLYLGLKERLTREEFAEKIRQGTLLESLRFVPVKPGEMYFIHSGTLHAIAAGTLLAEIQQNSNVTYRVYDFGRLGADGKPRPLHIPQAMDVSDLSGVMPDMDFGGHLAVCPYFLVDGLSFAGEAELMADGASFCSVLVTEGSGSICFNGEELPFRRGDSFFVEAGSGRGRLRGKGHVLLTRVPAP
ncbi:MAG: class I mannose-6-phosphate isomerase [Lachnospiraceae bacterium]|nr:class I mannose-6-phosphate isomerase [Lachnospiraceae bacterium]